MKTREQQEVCNYIEEFRQTKDGETFQKLLTGLFKCPLLLPQGKGDNKGQFLLAHQAEQSMLPAFTDMEEVQKGNMGDVDLVPYTIEEYSDIIANLDVKGIFVNMFNENNCIINKEFLVTKVIPAFKENRIMPALKSMETGEYIPVQKMPFSIGRSEQADLTIDNNAVNEFHSMLVEKEGKYYIIDRNSLNGVYVNGNKIEKEQEIEFDDVIEFYDAEYMFVPLGLADRKVVKRSIYGDDRDMIANSMFMMQTHILTKEFLDKTQDFLDDMNNNDALENYHKYFLISLETTCAVREKEAKIDNKELIEDQRKAMLGRGMGIFQNKDYGFTKVDQEDGTIYVVNFPAMLHIPGLVRRMYLWTKENGEKVVYAVRILQENQVKLVKIGVDNKEIDCGDAPATQDEELQKVLELGI